MEVVYIDASSYPRRVKGELDSALAWIAYFYLVTAVCLVPAAVYASDVFSGGPLWAKLLVTAGILSVFVLTPILVIRGERILTPSRKRVEAYGVTMRTIARRLARLRRQLDASTGWSRLTSLVLVFAMRLLAVGAAVGGVTLGVVQAPVDLVSGAEVAACLIVALALWTGAGHVRRPRRYEGVYLRALSLRLRGIALMLAALVASALFLGGMGGLAKALGLEDSHQSLVLLAAAVVGFFVCAAAFERFRRLNATAEAISHPASKDLRRFDRRRPILFLRSFPEDRRDVGYEMTAKWEDAVVVPLEDTLHDQMKRYGPFIAVAEPGRAVNAAAARDHFAGDAWRPAVQGWMDEAFLIAIVAGWTKGVQWELDQAVRRGHVRKLLVILPEGPELDARWRHVCRSFSGTPWHAAALGTDVRSALAVHIDRQGRLVVIASRVKSAGHYQAAVELAIYGIYGEARTAAPAQGA